jgi:hypothetical protein
MQIYECVCPACGQISLVPLAGPPRYQRDDGLYERHCVECDLTRKVVVRPRRKTWDDLAEKEKRRVAAGKGG